MTLACLGFGLSFPGSLRGATPACDPPLLSGKWQLKEQRMTQKISGEGVVEGVRFEVEGEVFQIDEPDQTSLVVDCNGKISGAGKSTRSGEMTIKFFGVASGRYTQKYLGNSDYKITGQANGGSGSPSNAQLSFQHSNESYAVETITEVYSPIPFSNRATVKDARIGTEGPFQFPVKSYDPITGNLELDVDSSSFMAKVRVEIQKFLEAAPIPVTVTETSVSRWGNSSPVVISVTKQHESQFLTGVTGAMNEFTATINWRQSPPGDVLFQHGSQSEAKRADGAIARHSFDMGQDGSAVVVTATSLDGQVSEPFIHALTKVPVPGWGFPAGFKASGGVDYTGSLVWPNLTDLLQPFVGDKGRLPFIDGIWSFVAGQNTKLEINAHSSGATRTGRLTWRYKFELPGMDEKVEVNLDGDSEATLSPTELKLKGAAHPHLNKVLAQVSVGVLDAMPGASQLICAASDTACSVIQAASITATLRARLQANLPFEGRGDHVEFGGGPISGTLFVKGTVRFPGLPFPIDRLLNLRFRAGAEGCLTMEFYPALRAAHAGGEVFFNATAYVLGDPVASINEVFPFNGGCGNGSGTTRLLKKTSALTDPAAAVSAGNLPEDAMTRVALGPAGSSAVAWSAPGTGRSATSSDIHLQIHDGTAWQPTLELTSDETFDRGPDLAFTPEGNVFVVWQRNSGMVSSTNAGGFAALARGMEIHFALVNPKNGSVISSGPVTANSLFDFGPVLTVGTGGEVFLAWQTHPNLDVSGTASEPVTVHGARWTGTGWSAPEQVARTGGMFGWRVGVLNRGEAAFVCTLDTDGNLATEADREVGLSRKGPQGWSNLQILTRNEVSDALPVVGYLPDNRLALAWMRNGGVVGLVGDTAGQAGVWAQKSQWLGPEFSKATMLSDSNRIVLVWPNSDDLHTLTIPLKGSPAMPAPQLPAVFPALREDPTDSESLFAAELTQTGLVRYSALTAPVEEEPTLQLGTTRSVRQAISPLPGTGSGSTTGPRIMRFQLAGGVLELVWSSESGTKYVVQSSGDLITWRNHWEGTATGTEAIYRTPISATPGATYFRIQRVVAIAR